MGNKNRKKHNSFTLVEVLIGTFLMLLVFLAIFGVYQLGLKIILFSKNRISATSIANGEIEKIRNLPYESVGVEGGFPDGVLVAQKTITMNGIEYAVKTSVDYVTDSTDGLAPPDDDCLNDYKKVKIEVSWGGKSPGEVELSTDIAPKNLAQECAESGGILSVSVADANGIMVSSPLIEVKNPETDTTIKTATPSEGQHYFSLSPATYKIVVSKEGYSTERTYGIDEIAQPDRSNPIVIEGEVVELSFLIDKLSTLIVETRGEYDPEKDEYPVIQGAPFNLQGEKILGKDSEGEPVYKYSENHVTGADGNVTISNLEWDSYTITSLNSNLDVVRIESPPSEEIEQPFGLAPDTTKTVRLILDAENSLLVTVKDQDTRLPLFPVDVRLYNEELEYDNTQYVDEEGETYFIPLDAGQYNIEAHSPGFLDYSGVVSVSGDNRITIYLQREEE